jgi:hypothetical protein
MSVIVTTNAPKALLAEIKEQINLRKIQTWAADSDGDFTHTPPQWVKLAWFRPATREGSIVFSILTRKGVKMSREVYAVYHGRFIEMLLMHFDNRFSEARASAMPSDGDQIG